MAETGKTNWLDDLFEDIEEILSNKKMIKFNTNANRKAVVKKLEALIKESVEENTTEKNEDRRGLTITRPNTNKAQGFAVMTEGMSSQGDEVLQNKPADPYAHKIKEHNKGVRSW